MSNYPAGVTYLPGEEPPDRYDIEDAKAELEAAADAVTEGEPWVAESCWAWIAYDEKEERFVAVAMHGDLEIWILDFGVSGEYETRTPISAATLCHLAAQDECAEIDWADPDSIREAFPNIRPLYGPDCADELSRFFTDGGHI